MEFRNPLSSPLFRGIGYGLGAAALAALLFAFGVHVGYRKAAFASRWTERYERNFMGPHPKTLRGRFPPSAMGSAHGTFGRITTIALPELTISSDRLEQLVVTDARTTVRQFQHTRTPADLRVDDAVAVIGAPDADGRIHAKFIRILPAWPTIAPDGRYSPSP
ncbi:hypothetical protein HYV74_02075 [Candidatus Uhrbacteria bacterium]|nr:hypothetical protein [Candidatus Uhrbacteria bacterium]